MNRIRPYMNKFVKIKEQEIEDSYHSINLKQIKPINSKLMEHSETVVINHGKREMIKQVREMEIQRENKLLLQKIASVMGNKGAYSVAKTKNIRTKVNKSLNDIFRKRQMQSIQLENKRFLQRLQSKRATLNVQKMNKQWMENKSTAKRIANADFNLTSIKTSRMRSHTTERASRAKYENIRLMRTKVIDGQKMLIKIEFRGDQLKIIGDTQNSNDVKIIEIPKEEAIMFIEKDCQGRLQVLLEKLRYNAQSQSLFLVSEYLQAEDVELSQFNPQTERTINKLQDNSQKDVRQKKNKSEQNTKPNKSLKQLNKQSHQPATEKMRPLHHLEEKQVQKIKQPNIQLFKLTQKPTTIAKEMPTEVKENTSKLTKKPEHLQEKQHPIATKKEHFEVKQSHTEVKETKINSLKQQKYEQQQFFEQSHKPQHKIVVDPESADNYAQQFEESLQQPHNAKKIDNV